MPTNISVLLIACEIMDQYFYIVIRGTFYGSSNSVLLLEGEYAPSILRCYQSTCINYGLHITVLSYSRLNNGPQIYLCYQGIHMYIVCNVVLRCYYRVIRVPRCSLMSTETKLWSTHLCQYTIYRVNC